MNLKELMFLKTATGGGGGTLVEDTATGNPAIFTTDVAKPLVSLTVPLTYSQSGSGDPTPDNVRAISGVSSVTCSYGDSQHITVTFPPDVGTVYGGSLDLVSGVLTLTHKMQTITGEEQVTYTVYNTTIYSGSDVFLSDSKPGQYIYGYCSMAATGTNNGLIDAAVLRKAYNDRGIQFYKAVEYWGLESVTQSALEEKLQEWNASGAPLQVVYELETPITVQLTPNQINAIKGNNTVWTNTTGDLTIKYLDKA